MAIFDYDGTLTPIAPTPAAARLSHRGRGLLERLAKSERAVVAVVSGREPADLRARVGLPGIVYAGCHGLLISGRGLRFRHARARAAPMAAVRRRLAAGVLEIPGARVEDKGLVVSLHYRAVRTSRRDEARALAESVARAAPGVEIIPGKQVFDFVPRVGWTKGDAVRWIVARARAGRAPGRPVVLYAGDDTTDEAAFAALGRRGVGVRVGGGPTRAAHAVPGVREVHSLLRLLARATRRSGSAG